MKKIKIIFLAKNSNQNIQINNIINHIDFNTLDVEILYITDEIIKKKSFFFNFLLELIFFVEKKFANKIYVIKKNKKKTTINKKKINIKSFV